jgi:hypothetical protein
MSRRFQDILGFFLRLTARQRDSMRRSDGKTINKIKSFVDQARTVELRLKLEEGAKFRKSYSRE